MKYHSNYYKVIIVLIAIFFSINIDAQIGGGNCNSAPLISVPLDGSTIEITARYNQYTTASNQGLHPCVGDVIPAGTGPDTWFEFEANATEVLFFEPQGVTDIFLYQGSCGQLSIVDYIANGGVSSECVPKSFHPFSTVVGQTYYVQAEFSGNFADYPILVQNQVSIANQDCSSAEPVQISNGGVPTLVSTNQFETSTVTASGCSSGTKDAWYSFVAPECGAVEYFCFGGEGAIYGGTCGSLQVLECFAGNGNIVGLVSGQVYYMQFVNRPSDPYSTFFLMRPFIGTNTVLTNTNCSSASAIIINQSYDDIDLTSAPLLPTSYCNGSVVAQELWYQFEGNPEQRINAFVNHAYSEVYSSSCGSLVQEPCTDDGIFENLVDGNTYYLRLLFDADYPTSDFDLELVVPMSGQVCSDPIPITIDNSSCGSNLSYNLNNAFKTDACISLPNVWISIVAPSTGSIKIDCGINGYFYTLYNDDCDDLNKIASYQGNDDVHYINGLVSGQSYLLSIGKASDFSPIDFCIETNTNLASNIDCNNANLINTNTDVTYEEGKSVLSIDSNNDICEDDAAALWYIFKASSPNVIIQGTDIEYQLFSGICGSLTEISEVTFGADKIYQDLTISANYYLRVLTGTISDVNATATISVDDYTKSFTAYEACSSALLVFLSDVQEEYDLGVSASFSATPLPACLSSATGLVDSWISFNAINNGLYIEGIEDNQSFVLYSGSCGVLSEISCFSSVENDFLQFGGLTAGNQYFLRIIGAENDNIIISINATSTAPNSVCTGSIPVEVSIEGSTNVTMRSADAVSFNSDGSCDSKVSLWYEFTSPVGGNVILQNHTGGVAVYEDDCTNFTEVFCSTTSASSGLEISLSPSTPYLLRLSFDEYSAVDKSFVLIEGTPALPESNCSQAPILALSDMTCNMSVTSTTNGVLLSTGNFCGSTQRKAVFYNFISSADANYRFDLSSAAAHGITVFETCALQTPVACGNSPLDISLLNGQSYIIAVYPQVKEVTSTFDLCVTFPPISSDGSVGISVANPQAKLDVNGGIRPGFTSNEKPGVIRWNNDLEVYDGTEWKSATEWDYMADDDIDMQGNIISNVQNPILPSDVATKEYVDQFPDNDNSPSNELQTQTLSGDTLKTSLGGGFVVFDAFYDNELITDFELFSDNTISIEEAGNTYSLVLDKYDNGWNFNDSTNELTYDNNIGIYDNDPSQALSVTGTIRASDTEGETNYIEIDHTGTNGVINATGSGNISVQHSGDTKLSIASNGNVGIDDEDPSAKLSVNGKIRASDSSSEINNIEISHDGIDGIVNTMGDGNLVLQHDGDTKVVVLPDGKVGVGIDMPQSEMTVVGTITAKNSAFSTDRTEILHDGTNGMLNTRGAGNLIFAHNESALVVIKDNGNVGIGDDDPSSDLNVVGKITSSALADEVERLEMIHTGAAALINKTGDGNIAFAHEGVPYVVISPTGNMGVRDQDPEQSLSVTGGIRSSLNSAEFAHIEISHDGNTGIVNTIGNGNIQFRHDNLTKMSILESGNVGIGTTSPDEALSVVGVVRASSTITELERTEISHDGNNGLINTVGDGNLQLQHDGSTVVTIQDNSRVGIGTTSPDEELSVVGVVRAAATISEGDITEISHNGNNGILNTIGNGDLQLQHDGSTKVTIQDNGRVGIGTTSPDEELSVIGVVRASSSVTESERTEISHNGANGIINTVGDGTLQLQHDGSTKVSIKDNGNVGIGVADPQADLHIAGSGNSEAILLNNGNTSIQHGIDLISSKSNFLRILLDSDNNSGNGVFELFSNLSVGNNTDARVRFDLDGGISFVDTGGKFGVGVNNPSDRLHIQSDIGEDPVRVQVGSSTKFRIFANGSIALGSNNTSITDGNVAVSNNLGIGDSDPSERLSVTGVIRASNNANELEHTEMLHNGTHGIINTEGDGNLLFQHDNTTRMVIESGGDVGIGVTDPLDNLHVEASGFFGQHPFRVGVAGAVKLRVYDNGSISLGGDNPNVTNNDVFVQERLGLGFAAPIYRLDIPNVTSNGLGRARANAWVTYSDKRVKKNVINLKYGLDEILKLSPKSYDHHSSTFEEGVLVVNEDHSKAIGFIAQEVSEILEEVVNKPEDEATDLWAMDYEKLTPVLVNAIKEQQVQIQNQEQQIEYQKQLLMKQQLIMDQLLEAQNEMKASIDKFEEAIDGGN